MEIICVDKEHDDIEIDYGTYEPIMLTFEEAEELYNLLKGILNEDSN